ncbi:hypothetical protein DPMN_061841 [Dreissena polymorpha]|uniref:Uncharacterized protein n=1 Tax=Dreissena polymorpha TaxID=45954 RepID=A0A9D4HIT4_DREPO|nr:hypothetical protein DPMN_061795 [Dreissena polymorpha]KAH3719013.1 hypothetical protein DPMN_061841 [Dreissena polymorpha]
MFTRSQIVSPEVPLTHHKCLFQGVDFSRRQGFPSIYEPPQEALLSLPFSLLIPTDVDMC